MYYFQNAAAQQFDGSRATTIVPATLNLRAVSQLPLPVSSLSAERQPEVV
jgi:hypothetical protein